VDFFVQQCQAAIDGSGSIVVALFLAGLVAGFTHCAGMCGPFVVAQVAAKGPSCGPEAGMLTRLRGVALLPYHFGRMTTYVALGAFAGAFSQLVYSTPFARAGAVTFLMTAGILFFVNAMPEWKPSFLPETGMARRAGGAIGRFARPFFKETGAGHRYVLGLLLGFLPCGMLFAALMAVAATGTPTTAALAMAAYALGTVPALFLVAGGSRLALARYPEKVRAVSRGLMAFNGVVLFVIAGGMIL